MVQADRIEGTIGGDLVISSQQDSSTYTSDSKSAGVSIGIPLPGGTASLSVNASQAQADANFQAVQEQTGLFAGEEGFDLTVQGTTTLNAGAIDSTADSSKNQLITDDLEISTLDNTSEFDIQSQSLSLSTSGGNSAGQADEAGSQSNTTQAVLADGNIQINQKPDFDPEKTQGLTQDANDNQALQNNFSEEQVQIAQESVQASQILGNVAPKIVGDIAQTKVDEAAQLALEADQETDPIKSQQLKQQAQKLLTHWGEGGDLRVALHTLTGLANGDLTGAAASFATAKTIPEIAKALDEAGYEGAEKDTILLAISAAIGSVADGTQGAINTVGQTANNYLKHEEQMAYASELQQVAGQCQGNATCIEDKKAEINIRYQGISDDNDAALVIAYDQCTTTGDCDQANALVAEAGLSLQNVDAMLAAKQKLQGIDDPNNALLLDEEEALQTANDDVVAHLLEKTLDEEVEVTQTRVDVNGPGQIVEQPKQYISAISASKETVEELKSAIDLIADFTPGLGDVKGLAEAEDKLDLAIASIGLVPLVGDLAAKALKKAKEFLVKGDVSAAQEQLAEAKKLIAVDNSALGGNNGVGNGVEGNPPINPSAKNPSSDTENSVDLAKNQPYPDNNVVNSQLTDFGKYSTNIDAKVTVVAKNDGVPSFIKESFLDSNYRTVVTKEDVTVYRVFGGNAEAGGGFASTVPASNRIQSKIDAALLPEWKNSRTHEVEIVIPKGTEINVGKVASQTIESTDTVLEGGVDQILLPQNWPKEWIIDTRPVQSK